MPFLTYFNPASTDPVHHVDRGNDVAWLRQSLHSFLKAPDKSTGQTMAILGQRGIGKSTLARKVIDELREIHAATTLFLFVDCRKIRKQRNVYHAIAIEAVKQLGYRADVSESMLATARLLEAIASMDTVKQSVLYERITMFKQAAKLNGNRSLLKHLGITYDINIERSIKNTESLEGTVHFDGPLLRDAVVAFFEDLRTQGHDAIVVLDNLDELDHEAIEKESSRDSLLGEIDSLLGLSLAPIGLVLTVRTYFASSLTRAIGSNLVLHPLDPTDHVEILRIRLARESAEIRAQFDDAVCNDCIDRVATLAPTPLALLTWFNYLAQHDLHASADIEHNLRALARDKFATIRLPMLERVVAAFPDLDLDTSISAVALLAACEGKLSLFNLLVRYQIVLPIDFWHPTDFTLSPDLHFMWKPPAT